MQPTCLEFGMDTASDSLRHYTKPALSQNAFNISLD